MKLLSSLAAAAALSVTALSGAAMAQSNSLSSGPVSNSTGVVPNVSFSQIAPVLQEAGFSTELTAVGSENALIVRYDGKTVIMRNTACSAAGCAGLWMLAPIQDNQPTETLNQFNIGSKPSRATKQGNQIVLDRYLIADYGITRGSLVVNVAVHFGMIEQYFNFISQNGAVAVSFKPLMDPTSSEPSSFGHDELQFYNAATQLPGVVNAGARGNVNEVGVAH